MKNIFYIVLLCLFFVGTTSCSDGEGTIEGVVSYISEGDNKPVEGATVRLYKGSLASEGVISGEANLTPVAETKTGTDGSYSFTLESGNYWLTATSTVDGVTYSTDPQNPTAVMLIENQNEVKDIIISKQ